MEKEFYIGQPLIIKRTGERVTFAYNASPSDLPCNVVKNGNYSYRDFYEYDQLEPSTEFKFSEIIAGLEQGYFSVGTEFIVINTDIAVRVEEGDNGLYLERLSGLPSLKSTSINSMWVLVENRKEMTLEEIEAELGYKIKLK